MEYRNIYIISNSLFLIIYPLHFNARMMLTKKKKKKLEVWCDYVHANINIAASQAGKQ